MSPQKDIKFPPSTTQKQSLTHEENPVQTSEEEVGGSAGGGTKGGEARGGVSAQKSGVRKVQWHRYIYSSPGTKPPFFLYLEKYVNKELQLIDPYDPNLRELKLQVYKNTFSKFITEFQTYQPLLSAIKKEYENVIGHQQLQIQEVEILQSHVRQVREEFQSKMEADQGVELQEIHALKRERQQLQEERERQKNREEELQEVVEHLQSELSVQYLRYRDECDARKLLIWQLNDLSRGTRKREESNHQGGVSMDAEAVPDPVQLQVALKMCRQNLTEAQEDLNRLKVQNWDMVPRWDWDQLDQTHQNTVLQLKMLQDNYDQLMSKYEALLEIHRKGNVQSLTAMISQFEKSTVEASPETSEENDASNQQHI